MPVYFAREGISVAEFVDILTRSGLAERRPVDDIARLQTMIDHAGLIVTARDAEGRLVGVARALTDWSYACYLSDLAVDKAVQGQGIGRQLIAETRRHAGEGCMLLLVSAPNSLGFYQSIGMSPTDRAFLHPRAC